MANESTPDPPPKILQMFVIVPDRADLRQASIELNQMVERKQVSVAVLEQYAFGRVCSDHGCNIDVQLIEIRLVDRHQLDTDDGALLTVAKHSGGDNGNHPTKAWAYTIVRNHERLDNCHAWPEARARAREWWRKSADQRAIHKIQLEEKYKSRMAESIGGKHVTRN